MHRKLDYPKMLIHLFFIAVTLGMLIPFVLVIMISMTDEASIAKYGYRLWPDSFDFTAYRYVVQSPALLFRAYGVTILVTVVGTLLSLLTTAMIAYVLSRRDYAYNRQTTFLIFFTLLFSGGLVPYYMLMAQTLHLKDTVWAMILLPTLVHPLHVLILRTFLRTLPMEIIESAKMDGAREYRIFFNLIVPLSAPALVTLTLLVSIVYWNEWLNAVLFIENDRLFPLQLLLVRMMANSHFLQTSTVFISGISFDNAASFPVLSARMTIALLAGGPMMVIFPFFQKYFVKGLTLGSIKS
ncbi:sugar ABC transporter permease [Cohnella sp. CIP 111063]|uniref:carbohydrate ABC transporter permease n=1 Tax=unclassified Cohnella TaxID=2636738 RepID=UPI000B8BD1F8|nr:MULTISPECIES: carbohydrate ABC transporter permease [unclassified Cohnella]OXS59327.1 sugar ABC transporter permease [Cohnella sp. CIP 111063]PRX72353.1 putative aldouronate transport system permease protein [Cohnella sp. SGD-V74]